MPKVTIYEGVNWGVGKAQVQEAEGGPTEGRILDFVEPLSGEIIRYPMSLDAARNLAAQLLEPTPPKPQIPRDANGLPDLGAKPGSRVPAPGAQQPPIP